MAVDHHQTCLPEFNPWNPHGKRKEPTQSVVLIVLTFVCAEEQRLALPFLPQQQQKLQLKYFK